MNYPRPSLPPVPTRAAPSSGGTAPIFTPASHSGASPGEASRGGAAPIFQRRTNPNYPGRYAPGGLVRRSSLPSEGDGGSQSLGAPAPSAMGGGWGFSGRGAMGGFSVGNAVAGPVGGLIGAMFGGLLGGRGGGSGEGYGGGEGAPGGPGEGLGVGGVGGGDHGGPGGEVR